MLLNIKAGDKTDSILCDWRLIHLLFFFVWLSMGSNQYWAGRVYDLCVYFMTGTPEARFSVRKSYTSKNVGKMVKYSIVQLNVSS